MTDTQERLPLLASDAQAPADARTQRLAGAKRGDLLRSSSAPRALAQRPGSSSRTSTSTGTQRPTPQGRQKDKFVPLPSGDAAPSGADAPAATPSRPPAPPPYGPPSALPLLNKQLNVVVPTIFNDLDPDLDHGPNGRISVHCVADAFCRKTLEQYLRLRYPQYAVHMYPEVVHALCPETDRHQHPAHMGSPDKQQLAGGAVAGAGVGSAAPGGAEEGYEAPDTSSSHEELRDQYLQEQHQHSGDIFLFDYGVAALTPCHHATTMQYGVAVLWGLNKEAEREVLQGAAVAGQEDPLPAGERQEDEFYFRYSAVLPPHMQNDVITINKRFAGDHQVKLAISHALAQSTKLRVYEQRVVELVAATRHLPEILAQEGRVRLSRRRVAKLIGEVFLQRSAVYLLSSIMDTPDFFWSAPDHLQELYKRAGEYLELDTRTEVLGARLQVLQEMLDMLREHQNYLHMVRLEWIVIWLIVAEVLVGLVEILGLVGWLGREGHG